MGAVDLFPEQKKKSKSFWGDEEKRIHWSAVDLYPVSVSYPISIKYALRTSKKRVR